MGVAADPLAMEHAHIKIRFIIILILGGLWHQTRGKSLLVKTEDEPAGYKQLDIKHGEQGGDYAEMGWYINENTKCPMISGPWNGRDCQYTFKKSKFCTTMMLVQRVTKSKNLEKTNSATRIVCLLFTIGHRRVI